MSNKNVHYNEKDNEKLKERLEKGRFEAKLKQSVHERGDSFIKSMSKINKSQISQGSIEKEVEKSAVKSAKETNFGFGSGTGSGSPSKKSSLRKSDKPDFNRELTNNVNFLNTEVKEPNKSINNLDKSKNKV